MVRKKIEKIDFLRFFFGGAHDKCVEIVIDKGSIYISECFGYFREILQNSNQNLPEKLQQILISTLDEIGVKNWKQNYFNDDTLYGTEWELEIKINSEAKHYCFAGCEQFPTEIGECSSSHFTEEFKKLLKVLNLLSRKSFFLK